MFFFVVLKSRELTYSLGGHIVGNGQANMAEGPNMIECRLADGTNVLVKRKVTVKSDTKNLYTAGQSEQPATSTEQT